MHQLLDLSICKAVAESFEAFPELFRVNRSIVICVKRHKQLLDLQKTFQNALYSEKTDFVLASQSTHGTVHKVMRASAKRSVNQACYHRRARCAYKLSPNHVAFLT